MRHENQQCYMEVSAASLADKYPLLHELRKRDERKPSTSETLALCRTEGCYAWKKPGTRCPTCYSS